MLFVNTTMGSEQNFLAKQALQLNFHSLHFSPSSDKKTASRENRHQRWQKTADSNRLTCYDYFMVKRRHTTGAFDEKALRKMTE